MQFADRLSRLGTESAFEVLARARQLEAEGKSVIHLEIGEPDFDTPKNICEAGKKAIDAGMTHYCPSAGLPEARKAVAEYFSRTRGADVAMENVVVMPGAKPLIFNVIFALINAGDEVIYPNPGYPIYESVIDYCGGKPVPMHLKEEVGFRFSVDDLRALVTPKTKAIVINSPQNPTGGVLTATDLEAIYALAEEHDLWIMTDEIYSRIIYEKEFQSICSVPGALKRTVAIDGMSKTYSMTGWRLGYGIMPTSLVEVQTKLAINNFSCTAPFAQHAMIEALTGPQDDVDTMVAEFQKRRDVFVEGLNAIDGVTCTNPYGAFYVFPNVSATGFKSKDLATRLLDEAGIAGLSGTAFGSFGEGYLRFSYANSVTNIKEALARFSKFLVGATV
ncbi:MAG: pyridoxal phosphate-dependent aminotransferase [candidate division Zixibacteria bacterium]|nr:pyridoxal phosphate-dependent aminotransferase [candidate division Zixibacteria bacterium]MDH3935825.1 pyridoxal phosphate-dependent aminotransferase [candidate division Zixibacteria bacterium]MDH4035207.1 pyridoxal phosphate-dependent aminotransferase [candidate division Zixibacteria bacterium]